MLVGSLALSIGLAIFELTVRELDLSSTANESQYAIYAADSGAECALYWDSKCTGASCLCATSEGDPPVCTSGSAFSASDQSNEPGSGIICKGQDIATGWSVTEGPLTATTIFQFSLGTTPADECVRVEITKTSASAGEPPVTDLTAYGYNTCEVGGGKPRLERALKLTY